MKGRLANDQGPFLQVLVKWRTEMRQRALSVLLAEKDHVQISFISENKPFENASFVYNFL